MERAFKHGFQEADFFEVMESGPHKIKSQHGLKDVYELYGRNYAGQYLHIAYRREPNREVVFHMREMNSSEKRRFRKRQ